MAPAPSPRPTHLTAHSLAELAKHHQLTWHTPPSDLAVTGITHASNDVRPGDLFLAFAGARYHGATFAQAAREAGAVAILTDPAGIEQAARADLPILVTDTPRRLAGPLAAAIYRQPSRDLRVVGITGTNGKTTTSYFLDTILRAAGITTAVIGTVETRIGDERLDSTFTTPEATQLHGLLGHAAEVGVDVVLMEVSSFALLMHRVDAIDITIAAFTNLSPDHLDVHPDMEHYFQSKARLFDGRAKSEIVAIDDTAGRRLAALRPAATTTGSSTDADWRAVNAHQVADGQMFTLQSPHAASLPVQVPLPGAFNIANATLAIAIAAELGIEPATSAKAIAGGVHIPGRMQWVGNGPVRGIVDYAHSPDGVSKALSALRNEPGRLIAVVGAGGDRDPVKRPQMGAAAASLADIVVVTDDNPRGEDPAAIRAAIITGAVDHPAQVIEVAGRRAAIFAAVARAEPGDIVAVLGKGHERGQTINGVTHPFDDREVLAEALRQAGRVDPA